MVLEMKSIIADAIGVVLIALGFVLTVVLLVACVR
jgi:hypothetical protein